MDPNTGLWEQHKVQMWAFICNTGKGSERWVCKTLSSARSKPQSLEWKYSIDPTSHREAQDGGLMGAGMTIARASCECEQQHAKSIWLAGIFHNEFPQCWKQGTGDECEWSQHLNPGDSWGSGVPSVSLCQSCFFLQRRGAIFKVLCWIKVEKSPWKRCLCNQIKTWKWRFFTFHFWNKSNVVKTSGKVIFSTSFQRDFAGRDCPEKQRMEKRRITQRSTLKRK